MEIYEKLYTKTKTYQNSPNHPKWYQENCTQRFSRYGVQSKLTPYTILKPILEVLSPGLQNFTTSSMFCRGGVIQSVVEKF